MADPDFSRLWSKRGQNIGGRKLPARNAPASKVYNAAALPAAPAVRPPIPAPTIAKARPLTRKIDVSPEQFDRLKEAAAAAGVTVEKLIEQLMQKDDAQ